MNLEDDAEMEMLHALTFLNYKVFLKKPNIRKLSSGDYYEVNSGLTIKSRCLKMLLPHSSDSRMAGESVHFYDEVHELKKITIADTARKICLLEHIIEQYIAIGSLMENQYIASGAPRSFEYNRLCSS